MRKTLYVGDPHVTIGNLAESARLLDFVEETVKNEKVDKLVILGDLMHNHAIIRAEVHLFWIKYLGKFADMIRTIVLVGNHDVTSDKHNNIHSLEGIKLYNKPLLTIVDSPLAEDNIVYLPYMHDKAQFVEVANSLSSSGNTLVCHEDWDGAQYENGFYCPNGVKQEDVKFKLIIAGHTHKRSRFGKIILPGTARWLTASDANHEKGLWLVDHNEDGSIFSERFIDTSHVCTPIVSFTWNEGEEQPIIPEGSRATVELIGSSNWISKKKVLLKGKAGIKSKITDKQKPTNRKIGNGLEDFLSNLYQSTVNKKALLDYAKEIGIV